MWGWGLAARVVIGSVGRESAFGAMAGPAQLARKSVASYAAVLGDNPTDRTAFIRKANPKRGLRPGRIWTTFHDVLARIDAPALVLDEYFDLIIDSSGMVVLNQTAFEMLFRDTTAVQQRIPEWVEAISQVLPLEEDGAQRLAERCNRDSRLRKQIRNIYERGHLIDVTIEDIRTAINDLGLTEDMLIQDDQLVFDEADPLALARLLNEDLFTGTLSNATELVGV